MHHCFPYRTANVFKVNIDAVWTSRSELGRKIRREPIDSSIEAEFFGKLAAFFLATCDSDGPPTRQVCHLPSDGTHGTKGSGDHHGFSLSHLCHSLHTAVGGKTWDA